jgi:hypothetical protein
MEKSKRNTNRRSVYKKTAKELKIDVTWKKVSEIPIEIKNILNDKIEKYMKSCIKRKSIPKHKYVYILGKNKKETSQLLMEFEEKNPKMLNLSYPKIR